MLNVGKRTASDRKVFQHTPIEIFELGQKRIELQLKLQNGDVVHFKSTSNHCKQH